MRLRLLLLLIATVLLSSISYSAVCGLNNGVSCVPEISQTDLLRWYLMDGTDDTVAVDSSGNADDLICLENPVTEALDPYGNNDAYEFTRAGPNTGSYCWDNEQSADMNIQNFTISLWVNLDNNVGIEQNFFNCNPSAPALAASELNLGTPGSNTGQIRAYLFGGTEALTIAFIPSTGVYYHLALRRVGTNLSIYVNGIANESLVVSTTELSSCGIELARQPAGTNHKLDGDMSDVSVWGRGLSDTEIYCLYNGTDCSTVPAPTFDTVTPEDGSKNNTQVNITANCFSGTPQIYFDQDADPLTLVSSNGTYITHNDTDGTYYFKGACISGEAQTNGTVRSWTYDTTPPFITITEANFFTIQNFSTVNNYNDTLILNYSINASDNEELFGFLMNITREGDQYFAYTTEALNVSNHSNINGTITATTWPEGRYNIELIVSDDHTAAEIPHYDNQVIGNKIFYDTEAGNTIIISSQAATIPTTEKELDRYSFTFDFQNPSPNKIFFVECDNNLYYRPNSKYPAHFVCYNPETKNGNWIDFLIEGEEELVPIVQQLEPYKYKVTYNTNSDVLKFKSIGGLNFEYQNYSWYRGISNRSQSNNLTKLNSTISLLVSDDQSISSATAYLVYNGINYTSATATSGSGYFQFDQEVTNKEVSVNTNLSYYWDVQVTQTDGTNLSFTANKVQDIIAWGITTDCTSPGVTNTIALNFTAYDEGNLTQITDLDYEVLLNYTAGQDIYQSETTSANSALGNFSVCIFPPSISLEGSYSVQYSADDYPERTRTGTSQIFSNVRQDIDLWSVNLADAIFGRFKAVDNLESAVVGVTAVVKKTINGVSTTVETQVTDSSGLVTFVLDPNTEYDFTFTKTGYTTTSFSLRVTTSDIFSVVMGEGLVAQENPPLTGISYDFFPKDSVINNNTLTTFTFNLTSGSFELVSCQLDLLDENSTVLNTTTGITNTSACNLELTYNTGNLTKIISSASYGTNSSNLTQTRTYSINEIYVGEFSLKTFFDDLSSFSDNGFNDRTRLIIAFVAILLITSLISMKTGLRNPEGLILLVFVQVVFFSSLGWLNLPFNFPSAFSSLKQWGIAFMVFIATLSYLLQRYR